MNHVPSYMRSRPLTPLRTTQKVSAVNPQVLDALYAIHTTPYESSFLSRMQGFSPSLQDGVVAVDWDTRTPWIELMTDIREHYALSQ